MPSAVGIYCRISQDDGSALGVKRQERDCRELAERRGWTVGRVYVDNDVSAYKAKRRPAYRQLLEDLKAGAVDAVVVWHLDRLTRRPIELEEFFEACDAAGVKDLASVTGDVDLGTHDGQFMARILAAVARKESDDKSRRTRRKHLELAEAGRAVGGGRPFGYEGDRVTLRPAEAALIREAAERVLAGESIYGICSDWMKRGVAAVKAPVLRPKRLRQILVSHRIAGLRALGDTVVAPGQWEAIIAPETSQRLRAVLLDPSRARLATWNARSHLLTGWLVCGRCGIRLVARRHKARARSYVCDSGPTRGGCGGIRIMADELEAWVARRLFACVDSAAVRRGLQGQPIDDAPLLAAVQREEAAIEQLARDHYVERVIDRSAFLAAQEGLRRRLEEARSALAKAQGEAAVSAWDGRGEELREEWGAMTLSRQRAVIGALVDEIRIGPAKWRGYNRFDPDRITISWSR